jgi:hypothetical protein
VIERGEEVWTGDDANDVAEYLREDTADGYPADRFVAAVCSCAGSVFRLAADADEGCARRRCPACGVTHFICDSGEVVDDSALTPVRCPCRSRTFEIVAGFSHREDGTVRWLSVGVRCVSCGILGCPVEWAVDTARTGHLYDTV